MVFLFTATSWTQPKQFFSAWGGLQKELITHNVSKLGLSCVPPVWVKHGILFDSGMMSTLLSVSMFSIVMIRMPNISTVKHII